MNPLERGARSVNRGPSGGWPVGSRSLLLAVLLLSPTGCASGAPWMEHQQQGLDARLQAMAVDYVLDQPEDWAFSRSPEVVCLGVGRYVENALGRSVRDDQWDPGGPFLRQLGDQSWPIRPLSDCRTKNDGTEGLEGSGRSAMVVAVPQVNWRSPDVGTILVYVQESTFRRHRYECEAERLAGEWSLNYCLFRR